MNPPESWPSTVSGDDPPGVAFPPASLSAETRQKLADLAGELRQWNQRVNLVSRKAIDSLEQRQLLPCLVLGDVFGPPPPAGTRVLDVGCGGGLPGLVLACLWPQAHIMLVDSVGKKVKAVQAMAEALSLANVQARQTRVETMTERFDLVCGRAVTALPRFLAWTVERLEPRSGLGERAGVYYWKGGEMERGIAEVGLSPANRWNLGPLTADAFFEDKYIVHFDTRSLRSCRRALRPFASAD